MDKKLQVFVSSTFSDLRDERQAAVEGVLLAKCIPAGMELFAAGDRSQLDVIRTWIKESDAYMLILGARYGSVEPESQLSYTEIEYEYALSQGKPLFALVLSEEALSRKRTDLGAEVQEPIGHQTRLAAFRDRVLGRVSRIVTDSKDIKLYTLEALRDVQSRTNIVGWVRADSITDVGPLSIELARLSQENAALSKRVGELQEAVPPTDRSDLAGLDDPTVIPYRWKFSVAYASPNYEQSADVPSTWRDAFAMICPKLLENPADQTVKRALEMALAVSHVETSPSHLVISDVAQEWFDTFKIQMEALGLISLQLSNVVGGGRALFWSLTQHGMRTVRELRTIRRSSQ